MQVFLQAAEDCIVINDEITVTVLKIEGDDVILEIDAPEWLSVEESSPIQPRQGRRVAWLPAR